jgi:hypothetical protein
MAAESEPLQFLNKAVITEALARLNEKFKNEGVVGEICLFGGTAMVLAFNARLSTKDVDAIFQPPDIFRRCATEVASEMNLPVDWLNDGVKGFVSSTPSYTTDDLKQMSNLRIIRPTAEYLLAMKCMAARAPAYDTRGDRDDILFLVSRLGLQKAEEVLNIVESFYGTREILPKTHFMILEIMENADRPSVNQPENKDHDPV